LSYGINPATGLLKKMEENNYYPFGLKHGTYNTEEIIIVIKPHGIDDLLTGKRMVQKGSFIEPIDIGLSATPILPTGNTTVASSGYNYKYNGKELQDELGLNMYDYGWRNYMPDIGRWTQIDPLFNDLKFALDNLDVDPDDEEEVYMAIINDAEVGGGIYNTDNLNPYGYGYNNPVSFDDPDGRCPSCDDDPIGGLLSWTDVDDVAVAVTTVTRGVLGMYDGKPKHIDGTDASASDTGFLIAGVLLPVVSGGTVKKLFNKAVNFLKKDPGLGNQFKNKTLKQVGNAMDKQVKKGKLEAKPSAPGNKAYQNKKSKYSYNVDPGKVGKKGRKEASHVDVNYPNPKPKNVPNKKKLWIKEKKK
jgi:RHS repeat-associated protein